MQPASSHTQFWDWFRLNGKRLRADMYGSDEVARARAADELRQASTRVQPEVILEIGPSPESGPLSLIVSADGRAERVDIVKEFVASAPPLPGWKVTAFRPRIQSAEGFRIVLEGEEVAPEDIWFQVVAGDNGLNLTLHVRGLTPRNERLRGLGASLLAEHTVGERDAMTLLSSLKIAPLPADPPAAGLRPFRELAGVFDEEKARKYPPPGSLPLDPEGEWQGLRGTINGAPATEQQEGEE